MTGTATVDLNFQGVPGVIACYVLNSADGPVLIDPGPSSTIGALRDGLRRLGHDLAAVRHVLLTHIHLDHAGAAGTIAADTGASVYVHERGAAHLARPERLLASATQIYGEHMDTLWGEMRPISEAQLRVLNGGEVLNVGGLSVEALYTPGHAVHHLAWLWNDELFCGDVAGVRLSDAQTARAPTPPPDIDLTAWRASVERLRERDARALHLTHYGSYTDAASHWDALLANMARDAQRVKDGLQADRPLEDITEEYGRAIEADLAREGDGLRERMALACPSWMSVQGLVRYWRRQEVRGGRT